MIYAHGYVSPDAPVALPSEADLFVTLATQYGFAIAFSSYSENGWTVKDGAQRTHQLLGLFTSKFGAPTRVYLGGASMGGLVAIKLVEDYPGRFAGALAACAAAGGTRAQFDYLANTRALFDAVYPLADLPGDAGSVSLTAATAAEIAAKAAAAIASDSGVGALTIASIDQAPIPFANGAELGASTVTALVSHAGAFSGLVPQLPADQFFDNRTVTYTGALVPAPVLAAINANVGRFDASPAALNHMEHFYQPTGALTVPMLMLSSSRDPVVPGFHQRAYRELVTAAGASDLLVQRTIDRYTHCGFTPAEIAAAFVDLVTWVQFGIKPMP